jgi:hypothetical protein
LLGACVARSAMLKVCACAGVLVCDVVDISVYIRVCYLRNPRGVGSESRAYGDSEDGDPYPPIHIKW